MNKIKKFLFSSGMLSLVFFLSGCVRQDAQGNPDKNGMIYRFLVVPMGNLINYLVENFNWTYGWAIIVITIVMRIIILPLGINQMKKSLTQTEKMQAIKPQMDAIQAKLKTAASQEEQMEIQMEMQKLYSENNISMMGGMGCLPMLLQMPIFSALYFTARYTEGINSSVFYGINLGERSILLVAIAGLAYLVQSLISMIGIPKEQRKQMMVMSIYMPAMIVFMSLGAPAGVTLYWVVSGTIQCFQTYITNVILRPRIKSQIQEELKKNPPKQVVTPRKDVTPQPKAQHNSHPLPPGQGRNAGKQQRRNK